MASLTELLKKALSSTAQVVGSTISPVLSAVTPLTRYAPDVVNFGKSLLPTSLQRQLGTTARLVAPLGQGVTSAPGPRRSLLKSQVLAPAQREAQLLAGRSLGQKLTAYSPQTSLSAQEKAASLRLAPRAFLQPEGLDPEVRARSLQELASLSEGAIIGATEAPFQKGGQSLSRLLGLTGKKEGSITKELDNIIQPRTSELKLSDEVEQIIKKNVQAQADAAKSPLQRTIANKIQAVQQGFRTKFVDFLTPIEDEFAKAARKLDVEFLPTQTFSNQADRVFRAPALASSFIEDAGLAKVIQDAPDVNKLNQFLIARHATDLEARGVETGRNLAEDAKILEALKPEYEVLAEQVDNYTKQLLNVTTESGLISKQLAKELERMYPNYVPLNRIFNEIEQSLAPSKGVPKAVAHKAQQSVIQRIKGSEREIENPIESLIKKTYDTILQSEQNKAAKILTESGSKLKGKEYEFPLVAIRPNIATPSHLTGRVSYLEDGVKKEFATTKEIEEAAKRLGEETMNVVSKVLAAPVRVMRTGTTALEPGFVLSNLARDQLFTLITTKHPKSMLNPLVFMRSLSGAVGHGALYKKMVRAGGGGTIYDISRDQLRTTVSEIRAAKKTTDKLLYNAKDPRKWFRAIEDTFGRTEELTRLQQFESTYQALKKQGRTEADALALAAKAARENTVNFMRRGQYGKVLNSGWMYLNAGIQGSRTLLRAIKDAPVRTATRIALTLYTPVALAALWNVSDPKRKEAYEDLAEWEKENNIIIIPPNPTQDENGRWNVIKIPLSPGVSSLAIPVRRGIEDMADLDELKIRDFADAIIGAASPFNLNLDSPREFASSALSTAVPQALKFPTEAFTNRLFFQDRPIVPESMKNLPAESQVRDTTSGIARMVGKGLNVSPLMVEEGVRETTGGLGLIGINVIDRILNKFGVIPEEQIGGRDAIDAVTRRFSKAYGGTKKAKFYEKLNADYEKQQRDKFIKTDKAEKYIAQIDALDSAEERKALAAKIKKEEPLVFKKLVDIRNDQKLGLTSEERSMKRLNVSNGARAQFIWDLLEESDMNAQERKQQLLDWQRKKIISKDVLKQLVQLKKMEDAGEEAVLIFK